MGTAEIVMLGAAAYLAYSYMTSTGLFAPAAAAATVPAPVTTTGAYTTALTTQPAPPAVAPAPTCPPCPQPTPCPQNGYRVLRQYPEGTYPQGVPGMAISPPATAIPVA